MLYLRTLNLLVCTKWLRRVAYVAKGLRHCVTEQERNYNNAQESARKAAERGVRMLQARDKAVRKGVTVE